jgi:hypothetical protein
LEHGSLVIMPAESQEFFVHRLKKATKRQGTGARINLTFKMMDSDINEVGPASVHQRM